MEAVLQDQLLRFRHLLKLIPVLVVNAVNLVADREL